MLSCIIVLYVVSMKIEVSLEEIIFLSAKVKVNCCVVNSSAHNEKFIHLCIAVVSRLPFDGDTD